VALEKLKLARDDKAKELDAPHDEIGVMEAVITLESELVGRSAGQINLFHLHGVNLLAVSRRGRRIAHRLRSVKFRPGDVVVLQGDLTAMPETFGALHCLPLAERDFRMGRKESYLPITVLAAAMALVAFHLVPVTVAFFGAAVLLLLARLLELARGLRRDRLADPRHARRPHSGERLSAYDRRHRPDRRMAVGSRCAIAGGRRARPDPSRGHGGHTVSQQCSHRSGDGADRRELRRQAQPQPDPFLMAVAIGAACDFLTPIGHQCNTLVMGPGGYRFGDYWKLGVPLSIIVLMVGVPLIMIFWPIGQ
jgi:di/tricarboxylate transporter